MRSLKWPFSVLMVAAVLQIRCFVLEFLHVQSRLTLDRLTSFSSLCEPRCFQQTFVSRTLLLVFFQEKKDFQHFHFLNTVCFISVS